MAATDATYDPSRVGELVTRDDALVILGALTCVVSEGPWVIECSRNNLPAQLTIDEARRILSSLAAADIRVRANTDGSLDLFLSVSRTEHYRFPVRAANDRRPKKTPAPHRGADWEMRYIAACSQADAALSMLPDPIGQPGQFAQLPPDVQAMVALTETTRAQNHVVAEELRRRPAR